MISVNEALELILNSSESYGLTSVPITESLGRVLKEPIYADRDFPPFDRVSMDGIAILMDRFTKGQSSFEVAGIQPAGMPQQSLEHPNQCLEVMTGAILPKGCDAVIPYEQVVFDDGVATLQTDALKKGMNIHPKGKDRSAGDLLIPEHTVITTSEIGVLATVGKSMVQVAALPKVLIVSTGDELVSIDQEPQAHQIRKSNVYSLQALLKRRGIAATLAHMADDKAQLKEKIATSLDTYDVLLFSGAVSKGKYDFLPEVLDELGVEKLFHRVAQRPGKPFWFGKRSNTTVFAFPGNPISTLVNCLVYFYPWLEVSLGLHIISISAILNEDVAFRPKLTYFLHVRLAFENGQLLATPIQGNGSGDLASLVGAHAFITLPADQSAFEKGKAYPIHLIDNRF